MAGLGQPVLGPPSLVERSEHWNVDAQPGKHQLDTAEHECCDGCAGQVADKVDHEDLPEANNADDNAAVIVRSC